jgi:hypothetical protein
VNVGIQQGLVRFNRISAEQIVDPDFAYIVRLENSASQVIQSRDRPDVYRVRLE